MALISVAEATLFPGTVQLTNQPPIRRQPLRGSSARAVPGEVEPPPLQSTLFIQDDTLYFYILLHICSFFKRFHYSIPLNTDPNIYNRAHKKTPQKLVTLTFEVLHLRAISLFYLIPRIARWIIGLRIKMITPRSTDIPPSTPK